MRLAEILVAKNFRARCEIFGGSESERQDGGEEVFVPVVRFGGRFFLIRSGLCFDTFMGCFDTFMGCGAL